MTLRLHRAERTAELADALAQVLRVPLADPFQREVVAVPAKGVERWLTQRLATVLGAETTDGVAAHIAFPNPTRLVDEAVAAAGGSDADDDAWAPQRVLWQLLDLIDSCVGEPWCSVLAGHLGHGEEEEHRSGRRYAAAEHLRDLFRSYAAHRPQLLVDWVAGEDTDGAGGPLDSDQQWQAELFRRLRSRIDAPSPAERLDGTCTRLVADPSCSDLPERISLFGATRLTTEQRAVLRALAAHREVHLWLPHPSPAMWAALQDAPVVRRRRDDTSALRVQHPLLASLARDTRELQLLLDDVADEEVAAERPVSTLLQSVQAAIRDDRPPLEAAAADGTLQVHACHGAPRQVEVLREALLHLFQQDPTLEPRDVLVMCPDVETYAPLVKAAFGQPGTGHPGHGLRVRLADRSLRQTNPLLDTLSGLLALADGRVTASQVLDLAASPPVRRAFAFSDDDLERLREWVARSGIRWGLDLQQRQAFSLAGVPQNTWQTGLNRLLLGVAADESDLTWLGLALPLDDVDSSDIALAGRLAELVERLGHVLDTLQGPQPVHAWTTALRDALDLLTDVADDDAWMRAQAHRQLSEAAEHGSTAPLRLADVRVLLAGRLAGRPTRANFRTGELTVCTMVPMRSVPHRVIALLGLDDGVFPRAGGVDGDDVLQRDPCLGERDVRSEDRQLLLDALMSAGDHLLLLYTGADPVTGQERAPAVPLGEVMDVVRQTAGGLDGILTRHPLQPFDARNFLHDKPFSFDTGALAGARAAARERSPVPPLLSADLPGEVGDVALRDLVDVLVHPVKALLHRRLGVHVPEAQESVADALQAELEPLQKWDVGERMLRARLAGVETAVFLQAELRRGTVPPGPLGLRLLTELEAAVEPIVAAALPAHTGVARSLDVVVDLGGGRRLTGTVGGVHGDALVSTSYSSLGPKHRLGAWVQLLAAAATGAEVPVRAITTGRGQRRRKVWRSTLTLPADPLAVLRDLVALHDEGLRGVLPVATGATHEYAERRRGGASVQEALDAAAQEFASSFDGAKDRHLRYAHGNGRGDAVAFDRLLAPADDGPEGTRFGALARRLWAPVFACEVLGPP